MTEPRNAPQTPRATLHDRIEHDRIENDRLGQPAHSTGAGTSRIAAIIAASKAASPQAADRPDQSISVLTKICHARTLFATRLSTM